MRDHLWELRPQPLRAYGLSDAWDLLLKLKVLKPGMTLEEAVEILGEPTSPIEDRFVRWYHDTRRHVNPVLSAELKDGRIVRFRSGKA